MSSVCRIMEQKIASIRFLITDPWSFLTFWEEKKAERRLSDPDRRASEVGHPGFLQKKQAFSIKDVSISPRRRKHFENVLMFW